jgi:DNA primase
VRDWLTKGVLDAAANWSEELEGYVLGRGLPQQLAQEMQVGLWRPASSAAPDKLFKERNGARGEYRSGYMTVPFWSPRGRLIGVEFRTWGQEEKKVRDFRLPEGKWAPVFIGLTPSTLKKIWDGGDVWLVEGVFDMALTHAVPKKDVVLACGTARVSRNHLNFLKRFLSSSAMVHVAFDQDETGQRQITGFTDDATGRWIPGVPDRLEKVGLRNRAVNYRGGKDPGEIWESGGREALTHHFKI